MIDIVYKVLRYATILLPIVLLCRLALSGLLTKYRWLFVMFLTGVVRDIVLAFFPIDSTEYNRIWALSLPLILVASVVACGSAIRRLLGYHIGLNKSAVYLCSLGFGLTCFIAVACAVLEQSGNLQFENLVRISFQVDQCVTMLLAGSLLVANGFIVLAATPVQMPATDVRNFYLLTLYFSMDCIMEILMNLCPLSATASIEMISYASSIALYIAWIYAVAPKAIPSVPLRPEMKLVSR